MREIYKKFIIDFPKITLSLISIWLKKPYIIFFLHYQPERTSIPEANSYSYQYKTILFLKSILPKNINLLIKEHPDTYRNKFSPRFKSKETYKNLLTLPGLFLCDMNIDPFSLLDQSLMVSTLTGTVGIESICRGKKTIFFGINFATLEKSL